MTDAQGVVSTLSNPSHMPEPQHIQQVRVPPHPPTQPLNLRVCVTLLARGSPGGVAAGGATQIREPTVHATIITPSEYVGNLLTLCNECRGVQREYIFLDDARVMLKYLLPLSEIVTGACQWLVLRVWMVLSPQLQLPAAACSQLLR